MRSGAADRASIDVQALVSTFYGRLTGQPAAAQLPAPEPLGSPPRLEGGNPLTFDEDADDEARMVERRTRYPVIDVLRTVAGAQPRLLAEVPTDGPRYTALGSLLVGAAAIALLSMWVALGEVVDAGWFLGILLVVPAAVWGGFILLVDRALIVGVSSTARWRRTSTLVVRLIVSGVLGFVIAEPLVLAVFHTAIETHIRDGRDRATDDLRTNLLDCNPLPGDAAKNGLRWTKTDRRPAGRGRRRPPDPCGAGRHAAGNGGLGHEDERRPRQDCSPGVCRWRQARGRILRGSGRGTAVSEGAGGGGRVRRRPRHRPKQPGSCGPAGADPEVAGPDGHVARGVPAEAQLTGRRAGGAVRVQPAGDRPSWNGWTGSSS